MREFLTDLNTLLRSSLTGVSRLLVLLLFVLSVGAILSSRAQNAVAPAEVRELAPGEMMKRHMDAGAKHTYELALVSQQYAQIVIDQQGVDVRVRVFVPGGSLLTEMDSPNGFYGREAVSILAQVTGRHRLEVSSDKRFPAGDYELRVEGPRPASLPDELRVKAEGVFVDAQKLRIEAAGLQGEPAKEKYEAAIGKYNEALSIWREISELRGQGYSLGGIGRAYKALRQLTPALDNLVQALSPLRNAKDLAGEAFVLNEIGAAHRDLGDVRDALPNYESAIKLRVILGDRWGQAQLYNNLGLIYSLIGYQPSAAENYEKALTLWREVGMRDSEMNTLINAAKARVEMGDSEVALSQYQNVLSYCEAELNSENSVLKQSANFLKPFALNGIGLVYDTWGDTDKALNYYKQALELFQANKMSGGRADVLDNLGLLYAFRGDADQALEFFRQSLAIREQLNNPKGWGVALSNVGYAHTLLRDYDEALRQLALALPLTQRSGDRRFEAYTLIRMGMVYIALNEPRKALEQYEKALAIQQEPAFKDIRGEAMTLDQMGEALRLLGEPSQALHRYGQALEHWREVGDEQGQALSLHGIARVERDQHNLANARDRAEEAIRLVEQLRTKVTRRQLQMIYFAEKQDLYELAIDVRMQLYELSESPADMEAALALSERARARNLIDLLSEARAGLQKGMTPEQAEKNARLERQISVLRQNLFQLRGISAKDSIVSIEKTLASHIKEQDELLASTTRLGGAGATESATRPRSPKEIQQLLDDNTLLLQYSLGEKRSHVWTVTRARINHYFLKSRAQIETTAEQFHNALTDREPQRRRETVKEATTRWRQAEERYCASAIEMSRMILEPVSFELGDKRLAIVADGALQYIPFEALPAPQSDISTASGSEPCRLPAPLLSTNEVVYQPSGSTLALLREGQRRSTSKTVAVLADPVFDNTDTRLPSSVRVPDAKSSSSNLSREKLNRSIREIGDTGDGEFTLTKLDYSLREANAITARAPRGSWMKALGFRASRATATSPALKQFGIVHFATHGIVNDKHPELSGIVLSMVNERGQPQDGYLTLRDIYNLDLPAHLVVVSACRTGVGKSVRGEGLIGLTRGFMYAGARSVVVSLWRVDDQATAELMERFYEHMLGKNKLAPAAALRRAKLEMMEAYERRWRLPYYWAGFVLQGDWK
jgi:CHAT domain-containing protein